MEIVTGWAIVTVFVVMFLRGASIINREWDESNRSMEEFTSNLHLID